MLSGLLLVAVVQEARSGILPQEDNDVEQISELLGEELFRGLKEKEVDFVNFGSKAAARTKREFRGKRMEDEEAFRGRRNYEAFRGRRNTDLFRGRRDNPVLY